MGQLEEKRPTLDRSYDVAEEMEDPEFFNRHPPQKVAYPEPEEPQAIEPSYEQQTSYTDPPAYDGAMAQMAGMPAMGGVGYQGGGVGYQPPHATAPYQQEGPPLAAHGALYTGQPEAEPMVYRLDKNAPHKGSKDTFV